MGDVRLPTATFGAPLPGVAYRERPGAYAIALGADGRLPLVRTPTGLFLLGGGQEPGESLPQCLQRECREEAGLAMRVGPLLCVGDQYRWSKTHGCFMHAVGYFFAAQVEGPVCAPTEPDHTLLWLPARECCGQLYLAFQAWALGQALKCLP